MEKCCEGVVKWCRGVVWGSVVEALWGSAAGTSCEDVLWRSVGKECCEGVLQRTVVKKCCGEVLL